MSTNAPRLTPALRPITLDAVRRLLSFIILLAACDPSPSGAPRFERDAELIEDAGENADSASPFDASVLGDASPFDAFVQPLDGATDATADSAASQFDAGRPDASAGDSGTPAAIVTGLDPLLVFELENAPFSADSYPDVAVHVPDGLDLARNPGVVVFFHGWLNCAANVMGSTNTKCSASGPAREALSLIDQFETANVNAVLVAVQLRYEAESSSAGRLTESGLCRAMLDELFTEHLSPLFPYELGVDDLSAVVLAAHSGGYLSMARCMSEGGLTNLREVQLYDGFYGEYATYSSFILDNVERFDRSRTDFLKFSTVYIAGTGTASLSTTLASAATSSFAAADLSGELMVDPTTSTFTPEIFQIPAIFKRSSLTHYGIPRYYFQRFVAASPFERLH